MASERIAHSCAGYFRKSVAIYPDFSPTTFGQRQHHNAQTLAAKLQRITTAHTRHVEKVTRSHAERSQSLWADWTLLGHEAAGTPPVLDHVVEEIVDGRQLARPVNDQLLRIVPPEGVELHGWKRPYMMIDPRAGHGAGIGGFKTSVIRMLILLADSRGSVRRDRLERSSEVRRRSASIRKR